MNKKIWTLIALSGFAAVQSTVQADHNYGSPNVGSPYSAQQNYHDGLTHRSYDRQQVHGQSHNYPMTYSQHNGLHGSLSAQIYHDNVGHQVFDRSYGSGSYGNGYGLGTSRQHSGMGSPLSMPGHHSNGHGGTSWSYRW